MNETGACGVKKHPRFFSAAGLLAGAVNRQGRRGRRLCGSTIAKHVLGTKGKSMLQHHFHPTERSIYAFTVLFVVGFVALLPWDAGSQSRSGSGALASIQQRLPARAVTASVEDAQNFAAERLCRGVVSGDRCATFAAPATAL
jgi:hypothetical protein